MRPTLGVARPLVFALAGVGRPRAPMMLRNVDRCELLLVTASAASEICADGCALLAEADADGTLTVVDDGEGSEELPSPLTARALSSLRRSLSLAPDGFGGSDGFGQAPTQVGVASRSAWNSRTARWLSSHRAGPHRWSGHPPRRTARAIA